MWKPKQKEKNENAKPGRKPLVSGDIVLEELKLVVNDLFSSNGKLIPYSHELWNTISDKLDGKLTPKHLFISVYQDRHSWQTILRSIVSKPLVYDSLEIGEKSDNNDISETDEGSEGTSDGKIICKVDIPYRDYIKMGPIQVKYGKKTNKKSFTVLKQGIWTNMINDYLIKTSKVNCNFIYKRCRVAMDFSKSKHFLHFSGVCKECGAKLIGWADNKPDEAMPLNVSIVIENMDITLTHTSKRPLNGEKRHDIGKELLHDCASNWRRNATNTLKFGEKIPANLYNKDVLRKCKQGEKDMRLGITEKCPIMSLIELKHSKYAGSIHLICADPFITHYWTPSQLVVYKNHRKSYVRMAIDATGSVVKKIKRTKEGLLSSHIFLYEAVISSDKFQVSITQMVSEKQDTFTIFSWLSMWLIDGVKAPQETVCDYSMALLGGITRAFCDGMALHAYVDACLVILKGRTNTHHNILKCYVRIDIAHLIKIVCRWKCWNRIRTPHLKDFFVRCVVLLIKSEDLSSFTGHLTDILTVSFSEYDGQYDNGVEQVNCPSEDARIRLIENIKGTSYLMTTTDISDRDDGALNEINIDKILGSEMANFLADIKCRCNLNSSTVGNRLNAYYSLEISKNILRLCKQFPLWTNVMKQYFMSPYDSATSAPVEGDFSNLKSNILRHEYGPISADRFVITHIKSLDCSMKLAHGEQSHTENMNKDHNMNCSESFNVSNNLYHVTHISSEVENENNEVGLEISSESKKEQDLKELCLKDSSDESDVNNTSNASSPSSAVSYCTLSDEETWKGLTNKRTGPLQKPNVKKNRSTKYTEPCTEIDRILNRSRMRSHKKTLILNGNISYQCKFKGKTYIVSQTCPFDSVVVAIAVSYTDNANYKTYIDNTQNKLLQFAKNLALYGGTKSLYEERVKLLMMFFDKLEVYFNVVTINAECNVTKIIQSYLNNNPSATQNIDCHKCGKKTLNSPTVILPIAQDFQSLQSSLLDYTKEEKIMCRKCKGFKNSVRILGPHLFIDTDINNIHIKLDEIPTLLCEKFQLVAVINYVPGHYITYVRRTITKTWELHNDLNQKIMIVKNSNVIVNPHIIVYVQN